MTLKPGKTSGPIQGDFIYWHHIKPRVQLYVPKEETFPIPLKHFDVTRATNTNLDVLQESRVDDYWNVDVDRSLSDSWTGFKKFIFFVKRKNLLQDTCGSGSAVRRSKQLPDLIFCGLKCGPACQMQVRRRKRKNGPWRNQSVDNARRLRCIYFIDPEDGEERERSHKKREEKVGDSYGGGQCLAKREQRCA